jgi:hypothetical protein
MRVAYKVSYLLFYVTGHLAAWLAAHYRSAARRSEHLGPAVVPLQLALLIVWCPARAVSLGTFAVCESLAPRVTAEA